MIIDSHAHYAHKRYENEFPYLDYQNGAFCPARGDRKTMLDAMAHSGISLCIEAGIDLSQVENQLALCSEYPGQFRPSLGVHPKKCAETAWKDRQILDRLAQQYDFVAIGETGLDYSMDIQLRNESVQKQWFEYQLNLAHEQKLPLVLHVRDAHADALQILRAHRDMLHGGVAHCFSGDYETAMAYIDLGFVLGIGGRLLHDDGLGATLQDVVRRVPLSAILVETDAPYILPDIQDMPLSGKQRKKLRNTSLILPAVIEKIAWLRDLPRQQVEQAIYQNTLRVFRLDGVAL